VYVHTATTLIYYPHTGSLLSQATVDARSKESLPLVL
jgi:hypothetical protein